MDVLRTRLQPDQRESRKILPINDPNSIMCFSSCRFLGSVFVDTKMEQLASLFKEVNRGDILLSMKLPKTYTPSEYEADIYALWEKQEAFKPKSRGSDETYSIVIPPPNANGDLHLGHGLTLGIEDIAMRYHRMTGKKVLFVPGADHAGFETQSVYEKRLVAEGKSRFDFTREELYAQIYNFVSENRTNYESQFRKIGASLDWSRYTYTLDQKIVDRAYSTFKKLWDDGLVYRGERLVNYCTFHGTGFADIEVEYKEMTSPLYYLKYGPFELATTRPETKFGDTAVAVHPDDERYKDLINTVITVEGLNGPFELRVIADEMVDPEFGTGAVKITPAHDFNDYEVGKRHNLQSLRVINHDGTMNHHAGEFEGMKIQDAREAVAKKLEEKGLLVHVDRDYKNRVGTCYKCGTTIEPMLMDQWFIKMKPLATKAVEALNSGEITFYPENKRDQLVKYLDGLYDWNISRQISWGIPIPAFQNINDPDDWIFDTNVEQEIIEREGKQYHRDPDVFDTWFSSGSWPYATLDYPDSQDFKDFYPLSVMETGADILYPWVSRMLMLGLYITGRIPFEKVYLHGLILDPSGAKMSKSKGNVVNPMEKIDAYGSDAFRMGIISVESPGTPRPYDESKLVGARNFCNKLWNIARYIEGVLGDEFAHDKKPEPKTAGDHWIIKQLNEGGAKIAESIEAYRFSEAYNTCYHLIWDDVADWYIEASKTAQNESVMNYVLETILKLAHPFAPFVTETIWQTLHADDTSMVAISKWPTGADMEEGQASDFDEIKQIVTEVRQIKTMLNMQKGTLLIDEQSFVDDYCDIIAKIARLDKVTLGMEGEGLELTGTTKNAKLLVDKKIAQAFVVSLAEKEVSLTQQIGQLEGRLNNESYIEKAPERLVAESRDQLTKLQLELTAIKAQISQFRT